MVRIEDPPALTGGSFAFPPRSVNVDTPPEKQKVPWWGYAYFSALLLLLAGLAAFCLRLAYSIANTGLRGAGDFYAIAILGVFGLFLAWYVAAVGWMVIRGKW